MAKKVFKMFRKNRQEVREIDIWKAIAETDDYSLEEFYKRLLAEECCGRS